MQSLRLNPPIHNLCFVCVKTAAPIYFGRNDTSWRRVTHLPTLRKRRHYWLSA